MGEMFRSGWAGVPRRPDGVLLYVGGPEVRQSAGGGHFPMRPPAPRPTDDRADRKAASRLSQLARLAPPRLAYPACENYNQSDSYVAPAPAFRGH